MTRWVFVEDVRNQEGVVRLRVMWGVLIYRLDILARGTRTDGASAGLQGKEAERQIDSARILFEHMVWKVPSSETRFWEESVCWT
jgi:hypothetical protein